MGIVLRHLVCQAGTSVWLLLTIFYWEWITFVILLIQRKAKQSIFHSGLAQNINGRKLMCLPLLWPPGEWWHMGAEDLCFFFYSSKIHFSPHSIHHAWQGSMAAASRGLHTQLSATTAVSPKLIWWQITSFTWLTVNLKNVVCPQKLSMLMQTTISKCNIIILIMIHWYFQCLNHNLRVVHTSI